MGSWRWVSPGSWVGVRVGVCVLGGVPVPGDGGRCPRSVRALREGPGSRGPYGCPGTGSRLRPGVPRGVRCSVPVSWVGVQFPESGAGSVPVQVPGGGAGGGGGFKRCPGPARPVPGRDRAGGTGRAAGGWAARPSLFTAPASQPDPQTAAPPEPPNFGAPQSSEPALRHPSNLALGHPQNPGIRHLPKPRIPAHPAPPISALPDQGSPKPQHPGTTKSRQF